MPFYRVCSQRQHGHQAPFAAVVSAQHQGDVFEGNNDRDSPHHQRQHAVDVLGGERDVAGVKNFFERVQNAGAYVPIDDTQSTQREGGKR